MSFAPSPGCSKLLGLEWRGGQREETHYGPSGRHLELPPGSPSSYLGRPPCLPGRYLPRYQRAISAGEEDAARDSVGDSIELILIGLDLN